MSDTHDLDWPITDSRVVGEFSAFAVRRQTARSPRDGSIQHFDVVERPDCVQAIAHAPDGRLILVEQYRHGVRRVSLEFPAGVLDEGEDPVSGAMRELQEETGYRAERGAVIGVAEMDPAIETSRVHVVRLEGCTPDGERSQDAGEAIQVRLVAEQDVDRLIREGSIAHAAAIAAWYFWKHAGGRT